ncbi:MAG: hypothetical protein MUC80_07295 [Candidatus Thermoplasmatota archaeon]|jgi:hypothetical protein|nr:hypothetical protein [Candidatus Thermoplasmatota archaeon]
MNNNPYQDLSSTGINPTILIISNNKFFPQFQQIEIDIKVTRGITEYDYEARGKKKL